MFLNKLEKKLKKKKIQIFNLLSEIGTACKSWSQKFQSYLSDHENMIVFGFVVVNVVVVVVEKLNIKAYFHLPSRFAYVSSRKNSDKCYLSQHYIFIKFNYFVYKTFSREIVFDFLSFS